MAMLMRAAVTNLSSLFSHCQLGGGLRAHRSFDLKGDLVTLPSAESNWQKVRDVKLPSSKPRLK